MKYTLSLMLLVLILQDCARLVGTPPPAVQRARIQAAKKQTAPSSSQDRLRNAPLKTYTPTADTRIYEIRGFRFTPDSMQYLYDKRYPTPAGLMVVLGEKQGMISHDGKRVIPAVYRQLTWIEDPEDSFIAPIVESGRHYFISNIETGKSSGLKNVYGIIDDEGRVIIPHRYSSLSKDGLASNNYNMYRELNHLGEEVKLYPHNEPRGRRIKRLKDGYMTILSSDGDTLLTPTKEIILYRTGYDNYLLVSSRNGISREKLLGPNLKPILQGDFKFGGTTQSRYVRTLSVLPEEKDHMGIYDQQERQWVVKPRPWFYERSFDAYGYWMVTPVGGKVGSDFDLVDHTGKVTVSAADYDRISVLNRHYPFVAATRKGRSRLLRLDGSEVFPEGRYRYSGFQGSFTLFSPSPMDTVQVVSEAENLMELAQERLQAARKNDEKYPRKVGFYHPFSGAILEPRFDNGFYTIIPLEEYEVREGKKKYRVLHENGKYVVTEL